MKQRYEIPLPLDEVKERLRADMQTDWPLGKLLRSVKRPANDRRGLYGQIEGERLWAVMMRGYDMYPKRVFFGTLRAQGDHTILEGGFRYPMQVLLKLAVLLAWILFGIIRIGVYTAPALLCEAALCEHLLCIGVSGRDSLRAVLVYRPRFAAYSPVKMSRRRKFCAGFTNCLHSSLVCGKLSMVSGMRRKGELPGAALNKTVVTKPDREGARVPG